MSERHRKWWPDCYPLRGRVCGHEPKGCRREGDPGIGLSRKKVKIFCSTCEEKGRQDQELSSCMPCFFCMLFRLVKVYKLQLNDRWYWYERENERKLPLLVAIYFVFYQILCNVPIYAPLSTLLPLIMHALYYTQCNFATIHNFVIIYILVMIALECLNRFWVPSHLSKRCIIYHLFLNITSFMYQILIKFQEYSYNMYKIYLFTEILYLCYHCVLKARRQIFPHLILSTQ